VASAVLLVAFLPALAGRASAAASAWTLTCDVDITGSGTAEATATWDWFEDERVIAGAGGTASCGDTGVGERPANANGLTVSLTAGACATAVFSTDCVDHLKIMTKSFDPADSVSATVKASASIGVYEEFCFFVFCFREHSKSSIQATFTMTS